MDPYHYENMHDPRGFPIHPQPYPHHPAGVLGEGRMRGGGRRRPGAKLSTDPQSVAARERRHRISDRFRVLRSLVPGGSKMDTVSMLEQAIHYVKFLKAQVSLHHAALMQHDEAAGFSHEFTDDHGADDEVTMQLPAAGVVPVHEMVSYHTDTGAHHQMQVLDLVPAGQMMASAHELPPLPSCVFDQESAAACYSVCSLQGEEADVHGSY